MEETDWRVVKRSRQQLKAIPDDVLEHAECVVSLDISESRFTDLSNLSLLRKFQNLTSLNLDYCGFNRLPEELFDLVKLQTLSLKGNHLGKGLNASIGKLKALKELNVESCELSDLPEELWSLEKLEKISLAGNKIALGLSASISKLQSLKELDVMGCALSNLPEELWSLQKLQTLSLKGNNLGKGLNASIGKLKALKELEVAHCSLSDLPEELWSLEKLETLSLSSNHLEKGLSPSIGKLKALKELNVDFCWLSGIPDELWSLENLEKLSLRGNTMAHGLSASISKLQSLKELDVMWCELSNLPEELWNLQKLQTLSLKGNYLSKGLNASIGKLKALKELNVEDCVLSDLPEELWSLEKLEKLSLWSNKMKKGLSASIGKLQALKELDVGWCELSDLPEEMWNLKKLEKLSLMGNRMKKGLSASIGKLQALKALNVGECELSNLPEELWSLEKLEILQLNNNRLVSYPTGSLSLPKLRTLDLSNEPYSYMLPGNRIRELPLNLKDTSLKLLRLNGNPIVRPPEAIWRQGLDAIKLFMTQLSSGEQKQLRVDTINMIGESEAGKSSIAQPLVEGKPVSAAADDRTRVMQRLKANLPPCSKDAPVNVNNFGGHHIYRCVIPLFLPSNGLAILAYNLMAMEWNDQEKKVKHWLLTAVAKSTKIRLVIAGTRSDLVQSHDNRLALTERMQSLALGAVNDLKSDVTRHITELEDFIEETNDGLRMISLRKRLNELNVLRIKLNEAELSFTTVSCNKNFDDFQNFHALVSNNVKQPELIPASWWQVMQEILKLDELAFPRRTMDQVEKIYKSHISDDTHCQNVPVILRYLSYSSQIIWVEEDTRLGCSIFHSPQKIVDICTKVLDHSADENRDMKLDQAEPRGSSFKQVRDAVSAAHLPAEWKGASQSEIKMYKRGILQEKLLKKLLSQYKKQEINEIVAFMESFNLISEIKLAEATEAQGLSRDPETTEGRTFVITGNLPEEEPRDLRTLMEAYNESKSSVFLNMSFVGCIVPLPFFSTSLSSILAVARKHFSGHVSLPWRHGLCIRFDNLMLLVKCNDDEVTFTAHSMSSERNPWCILYPVLQRLQENISASWPGVAPEWQIMCPGCAWLKQHGCRGEDIATKPTFFNDFTPDLHIKPNDKDVHQVFYGCSHRVPRNLCHYFSQDFFTDKDQGVVTKFYEDLDVERKRMQRQDYEPMSKRQKTSPTENRADDQEMNSEYSMSSSPHDSRRSENDLVDTTNFSAFRSHDDTADYTRKHWPLCKKLRISSCEIVKKLTGEETDLIIARLRSAEEGYLLEAEYEKLKVVKEPIRKATELIDILLKKDERVIKDFLQQLQNIGRSDLRDLVIYGNDVARSS